MKRENEFLKNSIVLSIGTVIPKLTSVITLPIITGCLTTAEYGTYDLITVLVFLLLPIATLQIQTAAFRFLIEVRTDIEEQKRIVTNIFAFTLPISAAVLAVLYFCLGTISPSIRILIIFYYFMDIMLATVKQIARGLGMNTVYSAAAIINAGCELVMIAVFLGGMDAGLTGAVLALALSQMVAFIFILIKSGIPAYVNLKMISAGKMREMLAYSWPMVPNSLSSWVIRLSDRLVLTAFMGVEANAVYAVANKLPGIYNVMQNTVTLAWQENASMSVNDSDSGEYYGKMFDNIFDLLAGLMAVLIAFTPIIFRILIRGDYDEAYNHMPILYMAALFSSMSAYLGGIYIAHKKTREIGITTALAAGINFLIDILLVNRAGIYAATLSTLISYFVLAIFRMFHIQKIQRIKFRIRKIICLILILSLMSGICFCRVTWMDVCNMLFSLILAFGLNRNIVCTEFCKIKARIQTGKTENKHR